MSPDAQRLRGAAVAAPVALDARSAALGSFGALVAGDWVESGSPVAVESPYDGHLVAVVHRAGPAELEAALAGAAAAFPRTRRLPSYARAEVLERISAGIADHRDELASTIALEAGKPLKAARVEVDRATFTFKVAAEESKRIYGEIVPLDWLPGNERRTAYIRRVPLGPIVGITPFNFPLNLVAHKVAPALAAGNPIVLRPASQTPLSALKLGEIVLESGWPANGFSVVPSTTEDAGLLVGDERVKLLTFTGSPQVGWELKRRAGVKRVTLELGGNAGVIVHGDADLDLAAERIAWGGFTLSGQTCISVQRVFVQEDVWDDFLERFLPRVEALRVGDPLDAETDVGPLIDGTALARVRDWVDEALEDGARLLAGGAVEGTAFQPTVLGEPSEHLRVSYNEVFGPVVGVHRYAAFDDAVSAVGRSDYGLQAGLFTHDLRLVDRAFEEIEVGGLVVNDVPTFRIDHMPYGGVKASGTGREGLRYAIEEMTELKLLALNSAS